MGGGLYDQEGNQKKIGKWTELDEEFYGYNKFTHNGEYNMNGMKVGRWDIISNQYGEYKQIGGGSYDQEGNQKKIGKWVELDERFDNQKKVTYIGEYSMNGMKVGRWDIMFKDDYENNYQESQYENINHEKHTQEYKQIGGGQYDQYGNQKKLGEWVELDEGFNSMKKVIYNGEYNLNGMKVGRWDIMYCKMRENQYKQIGGGSYDQEGNQKKIGRWTELDEGFDSQKQLTYKGEYNVNGMKVGRWEIISNQYGEYKQIGGGSYDSEGNQKKIGRWTELDEKFMSMKQITYNGEYNMNGMKVGQWDIMYCEMGENQYKQIGGGSYDQEGNQKKIGRWTELDEKFMSMKQITYNGEYNVNGMKVGQWDIKFLDDKEKRFQQIGGGQYDQDGNQKKIGKWVELFEGFDCYSKAIYQGEYNKNDKKVGKWNILYCGNNMKKYKKIGGGEYDLDGYEKKFGKWVELDKSFNDNHQVTYNGEYNLKGQKVGIWLVMIGDRKMRERSYEN